MGRIINKGILLCSVSYSIVSISGYITFKDFTKSNIYENDYKNSMLVLVSKFALIFAVLFAMPYNVMPIRDIIISFIHPKIHPTEAPAKTF